MMSKKAILSVIFLLLSCATAWAGITKGPYLQSPTENGTVVCFETDQPGTAVVEVGPDESLGAEFSGEGEPFIYQSETVYQYKVAMTGCEPGELYRYRVTAAGETTEIFSFFTKPDQLEPFRFVVLGDTRGGSIAEPNANHEGLVAAIVEQYPDLYFNTGDLVTSGADLMNWEYFFYAERELMADVPLFGIFGNHEDDVMNGLSGDRNWARYFQPPPGNTYPTFYSFDYVNVHFVVIDVEKWATLLIPEFVQAKWLREDLEAAQGNPRINFIFALFHEPPFSFKEGRTGNWASILFIQPRLREYGVIAGFEGHDHFYARCDMGGVDHIVTGGGGAPLYDFRTFPPPESAPGYRMHDKSNHYLLADVQPDRVTIRAIRLDGSEIETFSYEADPPVWPDDDVVDDDAVDDDAVDDDATDDDVQDDDAVDDDISDDDAGDDDDEGGCGC